MYISGKCYECFTSSESEQKKIKKRTASQRAEGLRAISVRGKKRRFGETERRIAEKIPVSDEERGNTSFKSVEVKSK